VPRYFLALHLSDIAKDRLVAVQPPAVPGMRVIERHELHLTLLFLGEVAAQFDEELRKGLARVRASPFPITISGVGRFPPEGQPQVLWAGVERSPALLALHHSITTTLTDAIGFRPEERPYSPHITLARLNTPAPPGIVEGHLEENKDFQVASVLLKQFVMYSSVLADNIPRYQEEAVFPLDEPASE
jgi:RNA 2',3'-cyclic 3'-phosphodiesterase